MTEEREPLTKFLNQEGKPSIKNMADPVVIDGVKGLGSVKEKKDLILLFGDSFQFVDGNYVIPTVLAC